MDFVDLDRLFIPVKRDADAALDWGPYWGRKFGGWLDWPSLLGHWRVVLLAEALSGKTQEFRNRVTALRQAGKFAFFASIEDLADDRFESALDDGQRNVFRSWRDAGVGEAWFFLDSVDEARLNGKRLTAALQSFRAAVSTGNLNRAHIVVSCRVSDWRGKADRESLQRELPYVPPCEEGAATSPDEVLLAPIFDRPPREQRRVTTPPDAEPSELLVVQLAPLTREQQQQMSEKATISNVPVFMEAVRRSGLEALCEGPGDLIGLIEYWLEHKKNRYVAHREAEVADRNEPDIIITSTSSVAQLAIEIKNANMGWTVAELERALRTQLVHDYLLAADRRHGILVVSLHRPRTWHVRGQTWDFARVISHLKVLASGIRANESGPVQVSVVGLNACDC